MKRYEGKEINYLIDKPGGLFLARRSGTLRRTQVFVCKVLFIIFVNLLSGCNKNANRIYFSINPEDRNIIIPLQLNDSITANVVFDTGAYGGHISLDSSFVASHPSLFPDCTPSFTHPWANACSYSDMWRPFMFYNDTTTVKAGNTILTYESRSIGNWREILDGSEQDGVFNIPSNDTTHIWELNFAHNYLEIHDEEKFKMPDNCILCPLIKMETNGLYIQIPMQIRSADGDTLSVNQAYLIDTGMAWDIVFMHPTEEESEFFNKREDAVWTNVLRDYNRYYSVSATLFDNFHVDSLRIYTFSNSFFVHHKYLIGLNFLKRFNVFFDMKNRQVGLQAIKNFRRIVNPTHQRFCFSVRWSPDKTLIVGKLADYPANYYKNAGLQEGDEIVSLNGKMHRDMSNEEINSTVLNSDTLVLGIVRNGQMIEIVVPVDKSLIKSMLWN